MKKKHFILGGDIKKSLTEGYKLDLKTIFKDAFVITKKNFLPLIAGCMLTIIIVSAAYGVVFGEENGLSQTAQTGSLHRPSDAGKLFFEHPQPVSPTQSLPQRPR